MLRPLHQSGQTTLIFEPAGDLPLMTTDQGKLSQILRNLIANALKFTPAGEVRVSASAQDSTLVFTVADTGIGIASEDHDRIFEEFTQVEAAAAPGMVGTGLGLPLSRELARLLGGTISLESAIGKGSTFLVRLPQSIPASLAQDWTPQDQR
jgi:signal transduction histidine kinase